MLWDWTGGLDGHRAWLWDLSLFENVRTGCGAKSVVPGGYQVLSTEGKRQGH